MPNTETKRPLNREITPFYVRPFDDFANAEVIFAAPNKADASPITRPILVSGGFGDRPAVSQVGPTRLLTGDSPYTKGLGRPVESFKQPRIGGLRLNRAFRRVADKIWDRLSKKPENNADEYRNQMEQRWNEMKKMPRVTRRRALGLLGVMEKTNIAQVDVIALSQGGLDTTVAAVLSPKHFNKINLIDSAGLAPGRDNVLKVIGRTIKQYKKESSKNIKKAADKITDPKLKEATKQLASDSLSSLKGAGNVFRYVFSNPLRAYAEISAIARTKISGLLKAVRQDGITVNIQHGNQDLIFPIDKIRDSVSFDEINDKGELTRRGTADSFAILNNAGHNAWYSRPDVVKSALELAS